MSDKDDQDWIDLLTGHAVPDADPKTVREAQVFRAALLAHSEKSKDNAEIPYPAIWEKLLARIEVEKKKTEHSISPATGQHYDPLLALAASIIIAVLIWWFNHDSLEPLYPPELVCVNQIKEPDNYRRIRGELPCVNDVVTPQTGMVATNLQRKLEALGATTQLCKIEQGWRVKTILPAVRSPSLEDWLRYNNLIALPSENNFLCINILPKKSE